MNKTTVVTAFCLSLLILTLTTGVFAQNTVNVGVQSGNSFKYSLVVNWKSTNPNATVPAELYVMNHTDFFKIDILAVAGTTVQVQTTTQYTNGENNSNTETVTVGQPGSFLYLYASGLQRGDNLFPGNTSYPWTINATIPRLYVGSEFRQTNEVSVNRSDLTEYKYSLMDLYFDQTTGMAVQIDNEYVPATNPTQTITTHLKLIETNLWAIPTPTPPPTTEPTNEPTGSAQPTQGPTDTSPQPTNNQNAEDGFDPLLIIIIAIAIVIPIAAYIVLKTGKKPAQAKPSTPSAPAKAEPAKTEKPTLTPTKTPPATMLICSKCGKENPQGSEFCNKCGNRLPQQ